MLPTSAGVEPATSWSPVGRRIQLSHRGRHQRRDERDEEMKESREEMKERDREERGTGMKVKKQKNKKTFPLYPYVLPLPATRLAGLANCKPISVGRPSEVTSRKHAYIILTP